MTKSSILIIEDERIIARGIEKRLKGLGYDIAGNAATGEEGVRLAQELRPDLVLMDIHLGRGMDGVEAAAIVRDQVHIPVVYLTAFSDNATLERAKLTEPLGYVLKPFEDRDLQIAIEIGLYRHRMERRLRENEQWLAATLGSIGDGVIATDERGRVRFMNSQAEQLTGWKQTEARDRDLRDVFQPVDETTRQPVRNPVLEALSTRGPAELAPNTMLIARSGEEMPIEDSAAPIQDEHGGMCGAVLVFRDITERRRLEEHLRQAQKLEAIGRLAGGVAHDFNNIMTVITGFSELLLSSGRLPAECKGPINNIHEAGKRAAALTSQIMAFSRKQILIPSVLNLNAVIQDTGMMAKRLIGSNIEFVTDLAADLGQVKADPTQISQVILNLAVNARDAMPDGGRLVIATSNVELGEETTREYTDVKPGRYAMLCVTDTGCGMPKSVLDQVFEPYFTTKGLGKGTGLGLATVYGIVKQSEGHIEVASRLDKGTAFRVYLPLIDEAPAPGSWETPFLKRGHETILLVEDDPMVRNMTKTILDQSGYNVLEASDGRDALAVSEGFPGRIDLLVSDLVMPHLSGGELVVRLSAARPSLKVLFISGYTEDEEALHGVETGASAFLQKPFGVVALTTKVREVLDRD